MTPKEKATELIKKFDVMHYVKLNCGQLPVSMYDSQIKACALICVDEILAIKKEIWDDFHREYFDYWQQVKNEIEKL